MSVDLFVYILPFLTFSGLVGCIEGSVGESSQDSKSNNLEEIPNDSGDTGTINGPWILGYSAEGRPIEVKRFGEGPVKVGIVAGIHGGSEYNTVQFMENAMRDSLFWEPFQKQLTIYVIPALNPHQESRKNDRGVNLNRNWPGSQETVPFSEVETRIMTLLALDPPGPNQAIDPIQLEAIPFENVVRNKDPRKFLSTLLFFHASAPPNGQVQIGKDYPPALDKFFLSSEALALQIQASSDYPYKEFLAYATPGDEVSWFPTKTIPTIEIELPSDQGTYDLQNQRALQGLLGSMIQDYYRCADDVPRFAFTCHSDEPQLLLQCFRPELQISSVMQFRPQLGYLSLQGTPIADLDLDETIVAELQRSGISTVQDLQWRRFSCLELASRNPDPTISTMANQFNCSDGQLGDAACCLTDGSICLSP